MTTTVRVGFSTNKNNIMSRAIRWFTKSRVSHAFLVYWDVDWERDMVMEATMGGFRIVPFEHYKSTLVACFIPKYSIEVGIKKAVDWLGSNFDYTGLFGMMWVELGRWVKRKWNNPLQNSKSMFCSEAVTRVLQESSYPGADTFESSTTTPEDLYQFFLKEQGSSQAIPPPP